MAGTNMHAAKAALIALLQGETGSGEGLEGVGISYSYNGKLDDSYREYIWAGGIGGPIEYMTMGATIGSRNERPSMALHLKVVKPGQPDATTAAARVVALGQVVETLVIANPTLGVSGVLNTRITNMDLDDGTDVDGSWAELTYQIEIESCLVGT